ncbi:hypothetical protein TNCV_267341 [Trichonephila clavipes]|nr:hypothetical protein TNCV_267341 [Trichonephila clavipes]
MLLIQPNVVVARPHWSAMLDQVHDIVHFQTPARDRLLNPACSRENLQKGLIPGKRQPWPKCSQSHFSLDLCERESTADEIDAMWKVVLTW